MDAKAEILKLEDGLKRRLIKRLEMEISNSKFLLEKAIEGHDIPSSAIFSIERAVEEMTEEVKYLEEL